jgi:type I restriction enzyme, R subunit
MAFHQEDRLIFVQIKEKAAKTPGVIQFRQATPIDKFRLGLRHWVNVFPPSP